MTCDEAEILLHALIDGELDAGHARDVEAHVATCPHCAGACGLSRIAPDDRDRRSEIEGARLAASAHRGFLAAGPAAPTGAVAAGVRDRLRAVGGRGHGLSPACCAATTTARITGEIVTAHLRSLQAGHLTDVCRPTSIR